MLPKIFLALAVILGLLIIPHSVLAQTSTPVPTVGAPPSGSGAQSAYQCAGSALALYMNALIQAKTANHWAHVKLLSPAFNIGAGDNSFLPIYQGMANAGAQFSSLDGIAVNAYNVDGRRITNFINVGISAAGINLPIFITEMGMIEIERNHVSRDVAMANLKDEIVNHINTDSNIAAALIFNAFGGNSQFSYDIMTDPEIQQVCGGSCGKIGVNSARPYPADPPNLYDRAKGLGMRYTLEIATTNHQQVADGVRAAQTVPSLIPIIRIGTEAGSGGFDDVNEYIKLLNLVDNAATGPVYAIAGPNEPNAEHWAAPQCNLPGSTTQGNYPGLSPLQAGFDRFKYPCIQDTGNKLEYNPLRPYPGSPCDPLIPKAWPEGPYMSFACGKSLNVENRVTIPQRRPTQDLPADPTNGVAYWCDSSHTSACIYKKFEYNVNINLASGNIPILGNTQDNLDDATRVNQYLLSYLAGTSQQADQVPVDRNNPSAISRLINFAGPLKKLLSFDSQKQIKSDLVTGPIYFSYHDYIVGCNQVININPQDYVEAFTQIFRATFSNALLAIEAAAKLGAIVINHGPEAAVTLGNILHRIVYQDDLAQNVIQLQAEANRETPDVNLANAFVEVGSIIFEAARGATANVGAALASIRQVSPNQAVACADANIATEKVRLTGIKNGHLPPVQESGESFSHYWDRYLIWHGAAVQLLPGVVVTNPLNITSVWASLFQNVPFTTLEDTVGEFTVSVPGGNNPQPEGVITGDASRPITLTITGGDSRLIFPHVKAINALAQLLQNIILPKPGANAIGFDQDQLVEEHQEAGQNPEPQKIEVVANPAFCNPILPFIYNSFLCNNSSVVPPDITGTTHPAPPPLFQTETICDLKDIRVNPGDYLYGQNVSAKLSYYQKFTYSPPGTVPGACIPDGDDCDTGPQCCSGQCNLRNENFPIYGRYCATNDIQQTTEARVAVFSKVPLMEQIYEKLVAGRNSVFRRFLFAQPCTPNCNDDEKYNYIRQGGSTIPSAIGASYSGDGTVTAGDKSGGGQIYIPRLGSLFDYFLGAAKENMNLQKMLRPKGVGGSGEAGLVALHNETMAQIAARLGVPVEYLDAIWMLETNRAPSGSYCDTCPSGNACGPMAIDQNNFDRILTEAERPLFNRCLLPDAFELAARVLLHKKYCLSSLCLYDPAHPTSNGPVTLNDIEVVGRYMGTNNCLPHPQTQCSWGTGVSYCDAIQSILDTGSLPPPASPADHIRWC